MATSKKTASTKRAPKAAKKVASTKSAAAKKIIGVPGQDEHFYKGFPRFHAYQLLLKAPKRTMLVTNFIAKVEKLEGVNTRAQANGILQKLVDKKRHVGAVCAKLA